MMVAFLLCYYLGAFDLLKWEVIKKLHLDIRGYVALRPLLAVLTYIGIYFCYSLSAMPGLFALDVVGGFFLPQPLITFSIAFGGMLGATALYLTVKYALKGLLRGKMQNFIEKVQKKFQKHQQSYLLFLRVFPFFPFGLVNIALAFLEVRTRTFMWTTFVGLIPAAYIYSEAGRALGLIVESDLPFGLESLCTYPMMIALIGIGAISLIPIFLKKKVSF